MSALVIIRRTACVAGGLVAVAAAWAQSGPTLTLAQGRYTLVLPYVEDALGIAGPVSARLSAAAVDAFTLEPGSVLGVARQSGTGLPSYRWDAGTLWVDLPAVEYAVAGTTTRYSAQLSSRDGSVFRVEQARPGPSWAASGGACRPVAWSPDLVQALSGTLAIEFEDITQAEGMMHLRLTNTSAGTLYFRLEASSPDGRVGLMAPQPGAAHLSPGESLTGYLLYYPTGAAGAATYRTALRLDLLDVATGRPTGATQTVERSVDFVRAVESAVVISDAPTQLTYARTALHTSEVGYWRYKVDDAERRIVLFPGQENWAATGTPAASRVKAYDLDGRLLWELATGQETWGGDASADGRYVSYATVATPGGTSSRLVLLDAASGTVLRERVLSLADLPLPEAAVAPTQAELDVREVRFSPDGTLLAVGSAVGRGYLFDVATLTARHSVQTEGQLRAIAFRGEHVYWGSGDGLLVKTRAADGALVWKAYTTAWPYSEPAFSPDGAWVAVGAKAGGLVMVDDATGSCRFSANHGTVRRVVFTPDGQHLLAASGAPSAGTVAYRVVDGQLAWRASMSADVSVTADARRVLVADGNGHLMDRDSGLRLATLETGFASGANYFKTAYISKDGQRAVIARRDLTPGDAAVAFFRLQP